MSHPGNNKSHHEYALSDLGSVSFTETAYQPINPLQPSISQETPHDALQQAIRRHFRINGVLQILNPWKTDREAPKIALHRGRRFAIVYFLSIVIPLLGAIFLVIINAKTTPLGDVSPSTVSALQFVAKFLDILMQVTLTTLALHLVRHQLLSPDPLPFGAVLAPFRVADASYLWSLDMWGSITSPALRGVYRIFFCITIPLIVLLAAFTGPSSAILVIPRRIQYVNNEQLFLFNKSSAMYPSIIRLDGDGKVPAESDLYVLADGVLSYAAAGGYGRTATSAPIQDASGTRLLSFASLERGLWATLPTRLTGSFVTAREFERNTDFANTVAMQPWVGCDCYTYNVESEQDIEGSFIDFGPTKSPLNNLIPWSNFDPDAVLPDNATMMASSYPQEGICQDDGKLHSVNLTTLVHKNPDNGRKYSSLFASVLPDIWCPSLTNGTLAWASVVACTMEAVWSEYQVNTTASAEVADSYPIVHQTNPKITIELPPDFVMRLIGLYMQQVNDTNIVSFLQPMLAITLANSLPYTRTLQQQGSLFFNDSTNPHPTDYFTQQQIDSARSWITQEKLLSRFSTIEIYGLNNWTDPRTLVQLDLKTWRAEYGYDSKSVPVRFALVVFVLYVLVTASHVIYTFVTGETGTSWDSVADLVMLALNSRKPPVQVGSTSIGVDSIATFREPVNVRINEANTAELIFEKDLSADDGRLTRVRRNVAY